MFRCKQRACKIHTRGYQLWFKFGLKNAGCIEKAGPQSKFCGREIAARVDGVAPIGAVRPNV
jgi:hypothetical protein